MVEVLRDSFPETTFRLHANVRIGPKLRMLDASTFTPETDWYYREIAKYTRYFNSPGYSFHAGKRVNASLRKMRENVQQIQAYFDCPLIVEGLYPNQQDTWLVSTWEEYRWLMESGLYYAIDLSHIHILSVQCRNQQRELLADLLTHSNCREIHISHNCGRKDGHQMIETSVWKELWWREIWLDSMSQRVDDLPAHFTEGNQKGRR